MSYTSQSFQDVLKLMKTYMLYFCTFVVLKSYNLGRLCASVTQGTIICTKELLYFIIIITYANKSVKFPHCINILYISRFISRNAEIAHCKNNITIVIG